MGVTRGPKKKRTRGNASETARALSAPVATADTTDLADYLELVALQSSDGHSSIQDLARALRTSGSAEALPGDDRGGSAIEVVSEAAFAVVEDRAKACAGSYPFKVSDRGITASEDADESIYVFLLLLSYFGIRAGRSGTYGERIFEDYCRTAAENYFGGQPMAKAMHFGFPRRVLPPHFPDALHALCTALREPVANRLRPKVANQKDAKLDLVVWRDFPDALGGKLVGFGQCAAGGDWRSKISEMQPGAFQKKWMSKQLAVDPVRMFLVPLQIPPSDWYDMAADGGILFDRCRIASLTASCDRSAAAQWSKFVLGSALRRRAA